MSLWQLPYFDPNNMLHEEAIEKEYVILSGNGKPPIDDAILDLSNPDAVSWYQQKLANPLQMGVGILTSDFGEAAPSLASTTHGGAASWSTTSTLCATTRRSPRSAKR
jgi:alpha-D-xyloside xylohydrolase